MRGLEVLEEWCEEWSVKVNAGNVVLCTSEGGG